MLVREPAVAQARALVLAQERALALVPAQELAQERAQALVLARTLVLLLPRNRLFPRRPMRPLLLRHRWQTQPKARRHKRQ